MDTFLQSWFPLRPRWHPQGLPSSFFHRPARPSSPSLPLSFVRRPTPAGRVVRSTCGQFAHDRRTGHPRMRAAGKTTTGRQPQRERERCHASAVESPEARQQNVPRDPWNAAVERSPSVASVPSDSRRGLTGHRSESTRPQRDDHFKSFAHDEAAGLTALVHYRSEKRLAPGRCALTRSVAPGNRAAKVGRTPCATRGRNVAAGCPEPRVERMPWRMPWRMP